MLGLNWRKSDLTYEDVQAMSDAEWESFWEYLLAESRAAQVSPVLESDSGSSDRS